MIQKHLNECGINWKLIDHPDCITLKTVLDNVMKDIPKANIGLVNKQADVISLSCENVLREKDVLDEETSDK